MTPAEILEETKSRFMVLYHNDPERLALLLKQALGKFQDKAGAILEFWQNDAVFKLPPHFRAVAGCCDNKRRYVAWRNAVDEEGNPVISLNVKTRHVAPFCLYYFCDLRKWPEDKDLPGDSAILIMDYLEALIAIVNTKMEREAYLLAGMNDAAQILPTEQELRQRVTDLEIEMESAKAIIPPASWF